MKKRSKYVLAIAGVFGVVFGIMGAIPSYLKESYVIAALSSLLLVAGLVLLAIALGD